MLSQISPLFTLTIWSECTARPTWAATWSTPGIAPSSSTTSAVASFIAGSEVPGAASHRTRRSLSLSLTDGSRSRNGNVTNPATNATPIAPYAHRGRRTALVTLDSCRPLIQRTTGDSRGSEGLERSIRPRPGVRTSATSIEAPIASRYETRTGGRKAPAWPSRKKPGTTAAITMNVAKSKELRIASEASSTRRHAGEPAPLSVRVLSRSAI